MSEGLLRPSDAAARLGIAANTLRVYSVRFAPLLSPSAAYPTIGRAGRPGHRHYSEQDLTILDRARDLVAQGLTYEQALARLRTGVASTESARAPANTAASGDLAAQLATLQQAVEAWRALADERAREVAELRTRLAALQTDLDGERQRRLALEELVKLARTEARAGTSERPNPQGSWLSRLLAGEPEGRANQR